MLLKKFEKKELPHGPAFQQKHEQNKNKYTLLKINICVC